MTEKDLELEQCRLELQALIAQASALSKKIDRIAGVSENVDQAEVMVEKVNTSYIQTKDSAAKQTKPQNINKQSGAKVNVVQKPKQKAAPTTKRKNTKQNMTAKQVADLENKIGKNIFAILASLLVLIGVGVFISTIYEQVPETLKIIAIYMFGFIMLGVGLNTYMKSKNNFWLGLASCGLSELLVSIITSHTYFEILPLPATFVLIIVWVIGSFVLTQYHPVVFKSIGYIGFTISTMLGMSLLGDNDGAIYISLFVTFVAMSAFFILSHKQLNILNTIIAFASTIGLMMFIDAKFYVSDTTYNVLCVIIPMLIIGVNYLYWNKAKLCSNAYPFFSGVSLSVGLTFIEEIGDIGESLIVPVLLTSILALWYICCKMNVSKKSRLHFSAFSIAFMWIAAMNAYEDTRLWFLLLAVAAYALYSMTKCRDIAWIGIVGFAAFCGMSEGYGAWIPFAIVPIAVAFLVLMHSKYFRNDRVLQMAWYICLLVILNWCGEEICGILTKESEMYWYDAQNIVNGPLFFIMAFVNTLYLHITNSDIVKTRKVRFDTIILLIVQSIIFTNCINVVDSEEWYQIILGIISSLLIASYGLTYSIRTDWENNWLSVWQFVKFTLYCMIVLSILDVVSIIVHIALLVLAIIAIAVGFKINHRYIRVYGLALSLLDIASLIWFNVDYNDSLQFAGGIILCGALCFAISFIYSKISKSVSTEKQECLQAPEITENKENID